MFFPSVLTLYSSLFTRYIYNGLILIVLVTEITIQERPGNASLNDLLLSIVCILAERKSSVDEVVFFSLMAAMLLPKNMANSADNQLLVYTIITRV